MTVSEPPVQLTPVTTVIHPQGAELLEEPETDGDDIEPELLLLELEEDEQIDAGARTNVRRNIDRFGVPPF